MVIVSWGGHARATRELSLLNDRIDHLQRSARLEGATAANHAALANALLSSRRYAGFRAGLSRGPGH